MPVLVLCAFCLCSTWSNLARLSAEAWSIPSAGRSDTPRRTKSPHPVLILRQVSDFDGAENEMQDVEDDDVVLIQIALVRARSESQDELEVRELVQVHNERGLRCDLAQIWSLEAASPHIGSECDCAQLT